MYSRRTKALEWVALALLGLVLVAAWYVLRGKVPPWPVWGLLAAAVVPSSVLLFQDWLPEFRDRRRRGVRLPIDWRYGFNVVIAVVTTPVLVVVAGLGELLRPSLLHRAIGAGLLALGAALAGLLVRHVRIPVDPAASAEMQARHEDLRIFKRRRRDEASG